ncbi:hypothetical protein NQ318_018594 [Aromia moschata]|uniref:Uncharacterized protein n=1 Tax=Aromia moschata TaxID=1265417 RepID=A0AAV8ZF35_9CUCU|nr:hypothetical protein NQ318_018594 [Aromia moschata]
MFRFFVIAVCALGCASAGVPKQQLKIVVPEQQAQASSIHELSGYEASGYGGSLGHDDGKSSNGAELTSLAHSSAVQANNAVQNQQTAGSQAAFGVANSFASAAIGAAQTAQAALVGKQAIVQNLKRSLIDAQHQLQGEIRQYQQIEAVALAAREAAQQAQEQATALAAALSTAQSGSQRSEQAYVEAANAAASQQSMVTEAKQRVAHLLSQIDTAVEELQDTEYSAAKAAESAQVAQSNAAAAGAAVAASNIKGIGSSSGHGHHY